MISRRLKWTVISLTVLTVFLFTAAFFAEEPLRRYVERSANEAVEGYSFQIGTLDLHPLALWVDLMDVMVRQEVYLDPPLADIHEISLDVQLAPLLAGKVSANVHLNDPVFSVTRQQIEAVSAKVDEGTEQATPWHGVTSLLENTPRDEVATTSDMSGPVENPQANTWQIIGNLVRNAFFNAILPGFVGKA